MNHWLVQLLSLAAFAALALATHRGQGTVFRRLLAPGPTRALRATGWLALLLALAVAVRAWGWGLGLAHYSGHTSAAAGLVLLALVAWERGRR
ncbi:MAG: DUF3325 family protein [Acidovorax sp.]